MKFDTDLHPSTAQHLEFVRDIKKNHAGKPPFKEHKLRTKPFKKPCRCLYCTGKGL